MALPAEAVIVLTSMGSALMGAASTLLANRARPHSDRQSGDAAQIQALLASATYWEGQAKRFQGEAETWRQEASEWHERFYRGVTDLRVMGQSAHNIHQIAQRQTGQQP